MCTVSRRIPIAAGLLAVLFGAGCSTVGSAIGITPQTHKLTATTNRIAQAADTPAPLPRELNKTLQPPYVLEPGDSLVVDVTEFELPVALPVGDHRIQADGTIDLGKYGRPIVAGKTVPQVEAELRKVAEAKTKEKDRAGLNVAVRLIGRESNVFYVLGEVTAPGSFPLVGRETALDAIIAAGGITRQASTKRIILSRPSGPDGCRFVQPICYDAIVQLGDTSTNYQVQAGDRIFIPSKSMLEDLPFLRSGCDPCKRPQIGCTFGGCTTPTATIEVPSVPMPMPAKE